MLWSNNAWDSLSSRSTSTEGVSFNLLIYFGCSGSLLLWEGFLQLQQVACGIFLHQGPNLCPKPLAGGFLAVGPPQKSEVVLIR